MIFDNLCTKGWSSSTHRTEILTMMGHQQSGAMSDSNVSSSQMTCKQITNNFKFDQVHITSHMLYSVMHSGTVFNCLMN